MRNATSRLLTAALLSGAASLLVLGHPAEVRAQSTILCPPFARLVNGQCGDGAFSGAALASQALSELSETTTRETARNTLKTLAERREKEKERCAGGFSRVDGICQPITPPVREETTVEPQPGPPPSPSLKKTKKPKGAAEEQPVPAPKIVRRAAQPSAMVCKDGPCAPPPVPIEPTVRFGAWAQVFGDYEHRNASGPAFVKVPADSSLTPVEVSIQSREGTIGLQAGGDLTFRGVLSAG